MGAVKQIKAGQAWIELLAKENLSPGLNKAMRKLRAFGRTVAMVGAGLIGGSAAIAGGLAATVKMFESWGSELHDMAQRTGISVESLSLLTRAAEESGASIGDLEVGIKTMQKNLTAAAAGGKAQAEAFAHLGLNVAELLKLDPERQFLAVADAISRIENPSLRTGLAMKVLGKSATNLFSLMANGAKGIEAAKEQFRKLGLEVTAAEAALADELGDTLGLTWEQVKMVAFQIGLALAPALLEVARAVQPVIAGIIKLIREHRTAVAVFAALVAGVGAAGAALVAFGAVCVAVSFALQGLALSGAICTAVLAALSAVLAFLTSPIVLTVAAVVLLIGALAALVLWATGAGAALWNLAQVGFAAIAHLFGGIANAILGGDLQLAWDILVKGLEVAWLNGFAGLEEIVIRFKHAVLNVWNGMLDQMEKLFIRSAASIARGWELTKALFTGQDPTAAMDRIDDHEAGLLGGVDQRAIDRAAANLAELKASRDASAADIAKAQAELDALLKKAADLKKKWDMPFNFDPGKLNLPKIQQVTDSFATDTGAFNAAAKTNIAAGRTVSVEEKMLQVLEDMQADIEDVARAARDGGLAFV